MAEQTPALSWFWDWAPNAAGEARDRWEDLIGAKAAADLIERSGDLPPACHLMWGAGFLGDTPRWLPIVTLVEFREALRGDSAYLLGAVGAEGFDDDVREPVVEYISTRHGDGIRVLALARSEDGTIHGRVDAALRLDRPAGDIDVLFTTRVSTLGELAVIGDGVDALMTMIADQSPGLQLIDDGTDLT
ncbi:hypothetical protein [Actinoplanes sp. NPDC020271]|uniref:hypothetical protein n=1 Tax=Actinoplanes sp. NPDC020271 TaxID=3363896 RepID=UPI0037A48A98